jgi:hypothetical protein
LSDDDPPDFQDVRMTLQLGADPVQILFGFNQIAQLNPTDCGGQIMNIRRLK